MEREKENKHYHIYLRVKHPKNKQIFMCRDASCSYRINARYLIGKEALCPYCGEVYILNQELLRRKLPHCENCTDRKNSKQEKVQQKIMTALDKII